MDLSIMGFDGLASSDPSDNENKNKLYGSDWRNLKMAKTEDYSSVSSINKQMLRSNSSDGQQMLSFSLNDNKNGGFGFYNSGSTGYCANSGYGYGNGGGMNGVIAGVSGPFTPSQWMELEHQALIYKYILANIAVPSNLLLPIKKALDSAGFSVGPLRPASYAWGGFHLGFSSSNTDPEPGRCRRTDGKKWRCSRDAVPDQKYCERHINRGRHRSRKPVEGLSASTTAATNVTATSAKLVHAAAVAPGGGGASGLGMSQQPPQIKSLQPSRTNPSDSSLHMNGIFLNKNNLGQRNQATATDLSMFSSGVNSKNTKFSIQKPQSSYSKPAQSEFGLVFSDSLLNPIQENLSDTLNNRANSVHHQFMDEWPKNHPPSENNTNLSISIPLSTSDFMSSTSSPTEEKLASSPLRLSSNWVPISWEGPLGEVLHNTNQTSSNECKASSGLNLMTDGWNSSLLTSSPNGPFQRMAFGSQSNSSAGSSPRGVATSLAPLL